MTHRLRFSLYLLAVLAIGFGCDRDETAIRTYSAPKDTPAPPPDVPAASTSSAPIQWTVPQGWKQAPGGNAMRYATFDVSPADPKAQVTVVPLPPEAADVLPNVKRWAGQLKLPAVTEADLSKFVQPTQVSGEQASLIDMTGSAETGSPPTRLLAAIVPHDGRSWFFTLKAPEPIVAAQRENFSRFIHSIQFPASDATPDSSASAPPTPSPDPIPSTGAPDTGGDKSFKLARWKTPEGWTEQPGSNAMRVTSFHLGSDAEQAEVIVSKVGQGQTGSFLDNINRWRGQVGLEPITEPKPGDMQPITVAGHQALLLDLTGPKQGDTSKRILVAIDIEGRHFWFVKMLGAEALVARQQDAFKQFLDSLQFEPESN